MNGARPPTVPGLVVGDVLGAGGFATTWSATAGDGGARVIKVGHQRDAILRARFEREAAILARVGAPAAPVLFAAGALDDGRPYLVLERVPGAPLREVAAPAAMPIARALTIGRALVAQVARIHAAEVVHGDLQPSNVLVDGDAVRVIDFGNARWTGTAAAGGAAAIDVTTPGVQVVTNGYAAPEQRRGAMLEERADLYAIGVILYELLAGARPFAGDSRAEERGHLLLRPPALDRRVPDELSALIEALLRKQPARRPASAAEVLERLATVTVEEPTAPTPAPPPTSLAIAPPTSRSPVPAIVVGAVGVASPALVDAVARGAGAWVARRRGERTILVWPGARAAMVTRARAAARQLAVGCDLQVVVHVAHLRVRHSSAGDPTAYGGELDDPGWLIAAPGVTETSAFAAIAAETVEPRLIGRDQLLAAVIDHARAALAGAPALCTLEGGAGTGRSRLLRAVAAALAPIPTLIVDAATARVLSLDDPGPSVVMLDDADRFDPAMLDAVEDRLIRAGDRSLWVLAATPELRRMRPLWGRRLPRHDVMAVGELAEDDAIELAAALLAPVEHAPRDALAAIVRACGRQPRELVDGVRGFVADGGIRQGAGGGWHVATERLDAILQAGVERLGLAAFDGLAVEVRELAHAVALIGDDVTADELDAILRGLDREGHRLAIDADTGLRLLAADGILGERAAGFGFRDPSLAQAAARVLPADRRAAIHRVTLATARARGDLARLARHGAAAGAVADAAAAWIELGTAALDACRVTDAERLLTQAIDTPGAPPALVAAARLGRGRARYLQDRPRDAIDDLTASACAAELAGDVERAAAAWLELATAHDLAQDETAARRAVGTARHLLGERPGFERELALADARGLWREGADAAAAAALAAVADDARHAGDAHTEVVARVMLGPTRASSGDLAGAATAFADALALCSRRGDSFHAANAYANRLYLREATGDVDGAIADLEAARRLARRGGLPVTEGVVLHNLAELYLRAGRDDDEVVAMAERARLLCQRFLESPTAALDLLIARLHAARGDLASASPYLAMAAASPRDRLSTSERLQLDVLTDHAGPGTLADAATLSPEEELEILYWLLRHGRGGLDRAVVVARALELVALRPIWRRRLIALGVLPT